MAEQQQQQQQQQPRSDSPPNTLTVRMMMQGKEVGSIIGKKGENVKRYREESGAKINISDASCPERIVSITGTVDQIHRAFEMMCKKFDEDLQVLQQATPGLAPLPVSIRLVVPASQCGSLIGKGGTKIKEIREMTGASVQVASEMLPSSTERTVTVSGSPEAVTSCIYHMCTVMLESPPKGATIPYRPKPMAVQAPIVYAAAAAAPGAQTYAAVPLHQQFVLPEMAKIPMSLAQYTALTSPAPMVFSQAALIPGWYDDLASRLTRGDMSMAVGLGLGAFGGAGSWQRLNCQAPGGTSAHLGSATLGGLSGSHLGSSHLGGSHLGASHLGASHLGGSQLGGSHLGGSHLGSSAAVAAALGGGTNLGAAGFGGYLGRPLAATGIPSPTAAATAPAVASATQQTEMTIPNELIGCIIGRGGAKINEIRQLSGAQIKISNCEEGSSDRKVTITGVPETIHMAAYLINTSMEIHKSQLLSADPMTSAATSALTQQTTQPMAAATAAYVAAMFGKPTPLPMYGYNAAANAAMMAAAVDPKVMGGKLKMLPTAAGASALKLDHRFAPY